MARVMESPETVGIEAWARICAIHNRALGVMSGEIPPALDDADMRWLIARSMSMWSEDYYAAAWLVDLDVAIADAAAGRVMARSDAAHEARRLVRLVETLGIDWPTDADLETAPEGGEA